MTIAELIESLMEFPLDAKITFVELRYQGGGDEFFDNASLDVWRAENGEVWITPSRDTDFLRHS